MQSEAKLFQHAPSYSFPRGSGAHLSSCAAFHELAAAVNDLAEDWNTGLGPAVTRDHLLKSRKLIFPC